MKLPPMTASNDAVTHRVLQGPLGRDIDLTGGKDE